MHNIWHLFLSRHAQSEAIAREEIEEILFGGDCVPRNRLRIEHYFIRSGRKRDDRKRGGRLFVADVNHVARRVAERDTIVRGRRVFRAEYCIVD